MGAAPSAPSSAPPPPVAAPAPIVVPKADETGKKRDEQKAAAARVGRNASFLGQEGFGTGTIG